METLLTFPLFLSLGLSTVAYKIPDFGIGRIRLSTVTSWMRDFRIGRIRLSTVTSWMPDFRIGRIGRGLQLLGYWTSVEIIFT
ncbi:unnamed protein product [Rhizophagus irregularis]|nr:unnamed protein product [Rhizophagus irregularis]